MIWLPPVEAGGFQWIATLSTPGRTDRPVGASGSVGATGPGVTAADGSDGALSPHRLCAVTVNVYAVPLVRPGTTA